MELNFKKFFLWVFGIAVVTGYVYKNYTFKDVLAYENRNQNWTWGPKVDYYIGMGYYTREQFDNAAFAFDQLLTNYPTCHYAPYALYRTGASYQNLNNFEKAREAYQKYMELYPQGKEIELVNKKFEYIRWK